MGRAHKAITHCVTVVTFIATLPCCAAWSLLGSTTAEAQVHCPCCDAGSECDRVLAAENEGSRSIGSERSPDGHAPADECPLCDHSDRTWTDTTPSVPTHSTAYKAIASIRAGFEGGLPKAPILIRRPDGLSDEVTDDRGRAASLLGRWRI